MCRMVQCIKCRPIVRQYALFLDQYLSVPKIGTCAECMDTRFLCKGKILFMQQGKNVGPSERLTTEILTTLNNVCS